MMRPSDGSVWVASNQGVHRWLHGIWTDFGDEEGLGAAVRDVREDASGRVWAETSRGDAVYQPDTDLDPPNTFILPLPERERRVPAGGSINLAFSARDKWNLTQPARLLFSWRLDDRDWSPFDPAASAPFFDLPPGQHYFQVRSMDRNGNIDPHPARLEFAVVLPWYREGRSIWIAAIGAAAALFFAGLALKRHFDLVRSYTEVERQVAERTAELKRAGQELVQSQKMTALGTLAAGIAHDFNNILSIIKGSAQIIEQNLDNPQKIRARADRIKTVVDQGSAVVQALLGFSRASDESIESCEINAVVDNTIRLLGDRFLREAEVRFDRGAPLPPVRASTGLIQQILLNFIFNAAESMTERKEVIVTTAETSRLPAGVALSPNRAANYVVVSVRDRGCGIAPEILPRIFEPFFTTKALSARRGTGLGLSVAYELARKMGAGLAVQSTPNQGSVFALILPVTPSPAQGPQAPTPTPRPAVTESQRA
jgi:signal transduction histidine kinase